MPKTTATATATATATTRRPAATHAHVCQTSDDSIRLSQALAGQGVMPLA